MIHVSVSSLLWSVFESIVWLLSFVILNREVDYNVADVANAQAPSSSPDGNATVPDKTQDGKVPQSSSESMRTETGIKHLWGDIELVIFCDLIAVLSYLAAAKGFCRKVIFWHLSVICVGGLSPCHAPYPSHYTQHPPHCGNTPPHHTPTVDIHPPGKTTPPGWSICGGYSTHATGLHSYLICIYVHMIMPHSKLIMFVNWPWDQHRMSSGCELSPFVIMEKMHCSWTHQNVQDIWMGLWTWSYGNNCKSEPFIAWVIKWLGSLN